MDFLAAAIDTFESNRRLADRAIAQVADVKLREAISEHTNSIAVIMKHVAGNLISRWTDFLTSDGEKPWRNRDAEFIDDFRDRTEIIAYWERGWTVLFACLQSLQPSDLDKTVVIRGQSHSVALAIERSLGHTCYHVGQIVLVARLQAGSSWSTLTIPKGGSLQFNAENWGGEGTTRA